ncbi:MAG: tetratricopeptide repeat protein [candidate division WOR-3 bacterium]
MVPLLIIIVALLVIALYPVVRDVLRQRKRAAPAYVEGLQLMLDGRLTDALARFKEAIETDTANVDAYIRLGDILMQLGETDRAIKLHENLTLRRNLTPGQEKRLYRSLVRDYLLTDRKVKAQSLLEELVRLDRTDLSSYEDLLGLYIETGSWEKCEELLKSLGRVPKNKSRAAALYAEFGRAVGRANPKTGIAALTEALKLDPSSVPARLYLGDLQLAQGDAEAAIRTWEEIIAVAPEKNRLVRGRLERAYYELGRYDEMTQVYERLLRKVPDDAGLAVALAQLYYKKEELAAAIRLLERFAKGTAPNNLVQTALAGMLLARGEIPRARLILETLTNQLREKPDGCRVCGQPLQESLLRCSACRTWQTGD